MRALIGHTGFVGSNLMAQGCYDAFFNSVNSTQMQGRHFTDLVCAGVSAVKWKANKDPDSDWRGIEALIENLTSVRADRFVLISTVDVYQDPISVTEADEPEDMGAAYGVHRLKLERWVAQNFANHLIIRLPALYGRGLKKNAIYDLQHDNMVHAINPAGRFQWYDVRRLEVDIQTIADAKLRLVNIAAEPVSMSAIADQYFPGKLRAAEADAVAPLYDVRTIHASALGAIGPYHFSSAQVLNGLGDYLRESQ